MSLIYQVVSPLMKLQALERPEMVVAFQIIQCHFSLKIASYFVE